jgi:methyl-accepting chemotaxis protein
MASMTLFLGYSAGGGVAQLASSGRQVAQLGAERESKLTDFSYETGRIRVLQFRSLFLTGDAQAKVLSDLKNDFSKADAALAGYSNGATDATDKENARSLATAWSEFRHISEEIQPQLGKSGGERGAQLLDSRTVDPYVNKVLPAYQKVRDWDDSHLAAATNQMNQVAADVAKSIQFVCVFEVLFAVAIVWALSRIIEKPLGLVANRLNSITHHCLAGLTKALEHMEHGDLTITVDPVTTPIPNPSKDEVGQISATFNITLNTLQSAIGSYSQARLAIINVVRQIAESASAVTDTSQNLAASAEETGAASNEIAVGADSLAREATSSSTIMEQLALTIGAATEGKESTDGVAGAAAKMSQAATEGNRAVALTVSAMQRVQDHVNDASNKVQELDEKGREIGRIVQSIEDIAGQTNLLALNAAIEAARAGEHGRGFAVVADEVRKLAEKAASATHEISQIVGAITGTVESTVAAIENTKEQVEEGAQCTEKAGIALHHITQASDQVSSRCKEMSTGASRVISAISNVAAVSEEAASGASELSAGIQEVSAAAAELSNMSGELQGIVSQFRIEEKGSARLKIAA